MTDPNLKGMLEYCPQVPTYKQLQFLKLQCKEALYGGAAAGGKSSALLMGALQYVHVPKYSALILRTSITDLELSGGLIPRSQQWLAPMVANKEAEFNGNKHQWKFKNGASISFGYLGTSRDKYRYGSTEFQYIAFDELTEFPEEDYLFLFSRLRRTIDIPVPLRMRAGTNPGGVHGDWVKARFITKQAEEDLKNDCLQDVYWKS